MLGEVVNKTGKMLRVRGMLYKAVVKSVLLYGSDVWVGTGGNAQSARGVSSLVSKKYYGDDGAA